MYVLLSSVNSLYQFIRWWVRVMPSSSSALETTSCHRVCQVPIHRSYYLQAGHFLTLIFHIGPDLAFHYPGATGSADSQTRFTSTWDNVYTADVPARPAYMRRIFYSQGPKMHGTKAAFSELRPPRILFYLSMCARRCRGSLCGRLREILPLRVTAACAVVCHRGLS